MKIKNLLFGTLLCAGILFIVSCDKDDATDGDTSCVETSYNGEVKAIIDKSCNTAYCHLSGAGANQLKLTTYSEASSAATGIQQKALVDKTMPPNGALSDEDLATLQCWIDNGIKEN